MKMGRLIVFSALLGLGFLAACNSSSSPTGPSGNGAEIYPMYVDANRDGICDA